MGVQQRTLEFTLPARVEPQALQQLIITIKSLRGLQTAAIARMRCLPRMTSYGDGHLAIQRAHIGFHLHSILTFDIHYMTIYNRPLAGCQACSPVSSEIAKH